MTQKKVTVDQALRLAKSSARSGDVDKARQLYSMILTTQPQNKKAKKGLKILQDSAAADAHPGPTMQELNGINSLYSAGKLNEALAQAERLSRANPTASVVKYYLGVIHARLGHLEDAVTSFERAIEIKPDYIEAHGNLGVALAELGRLDDAVASFERVLEIKPDHAEAHNNLGNAFRDLGQLQEAVASCKRALEIKPDYAKAHNNLGNALQELGSLPDAVASYRRALEIKPRDAVVHKNLGNAFKDLGNLPDAVSSYERALEIKPDYAEAHRALSFLKKYKLGDGQIYQMENLLSDRTIVDTDRTRLCFALAKAFDDLGQCERSIQLLNEGNRLRKSELKYNISSVRRQINRAKDIFSVENTAPGGAMDDAPCSKRPIFIVGMPRSGTTLVEQILASHSQVHGAGELTTLIELARPILSKLPNGMARQHEWAITTDMIRSIREGYFNALFDLNVRENFITDKMPHNFLWIGFIQAAFPEAAIINVNREPRATCWSNYKHYFAGRGNGYAYDMTDVAQFHNLYTDLMSFWRERYPGKIYDLCYEDLTNDQEDETRKLLAYCNLGWEDRCLDFYKTDRVVQTASAVQVRQKIYTGSSDAWKRYEPYLQPLLSVLDA